MSNEKEPESSSLLTAFVEFRGVLRKLVGRIVKPHDIDDILQETFIRAFAASEKTQIRHPRSFMLRTARNLALNHIGSAYQQRSASMEDFAELAVFQTSDSAETEHESKERFLGFCRAVRALPVQCRRVFLLKKVYGMSQQEIADYLGISESTVEKHVAKGLLLCRQSMLSMGYDMTEKGQDNEPAAATAGKTRA